MEWAWRRATRLWRTVNESPRHVDLILDVGANVGQTGELLREIGYGGQIVSFEPVQEPYEELSRLCQTDLSWECRPLALGSSTTRATINISANRAASSSFLEMGARHQEAWPRSRYVGEQEVELTTIDAIAPELLARSRDAVCLKVDVQGYELEVLRGAVETLPKVDFVMSEVSVVPLYEGQPLMAEIIDFLDAAGFDMVGVGVGFLADKKTGQPLQLDVLFENRALDARPATPRGVVRRLRRWLARRYWVSGLSRWLNPRIGRLPFTQHEPEPLMVPRSYLRTRPPRQAPTISIVTPSYNQAPFLEQTIRSVLSQGYPRLEYIVQDGGSSDESPQVLERYGDLLTHHESRPDDGQANAVNLGMRHAGGEILAYLNSDDLLLPGALNYVGRFFASHPEVELVHGNRVFVDEGDSKVGVWVMPPHDDDALRWLDFVAQETMFWRRSAWERTGARMDERYDDALDYELLLRFLDAGVKMVHVRRFLGAFRVHEDQKSFYPVDVESLVAELHRRHFGKATTPRLRWEGAEPYFRRHTMRHNLHRLGQRLPLPRHVVDYRAGGERLAPALGAPAARS